MSLHRATSFLQRSQDPVRARETAALAEYAVRHLLSPGSLLFIISGTTAARVAELALQSIPRVRISTNSVPVAYKFMQLEEAGHCAQHASVHLTHGKVSSVTGAILAEGRRKVVPDPNATLVFSPHGITDKGLAGDTDVDEIKFWVDRHQRFILPVSWTKLLKQGKHKIKSFKQWKNASCDLLITDEPHPGFALPPETIDKARSLLADIQQIMGQQLRVHQVRIPE